MAYGNGYNGGGSTYTGGETGSTLDLPFTTAATDFIKKVNLDDNRKLQEIDFAASDFLSLKDALISYIQAVYPLDYQNFNESDLGMVLVELVAYMGAVMSMKVDMLANENFLATAQNRANVAKILNLIGVRMMGPISAAANAKITLTNGLTTDTLTVAPSSRTLTVTSPMDGMPLSFTLYKVNNGVLVPANGQSEVVLNKRDASNEDYTVFENLALVEGALVVETGFVFPTDGIKTITLSENPVVENSVEVFFNGGAAGASGAYTDVDNLYMASATDQRIFEIETNENGNSTVVFGDGFNGISPSPNSSYFSWE